MSRTHISAELRRLVKNRAQFLCEYCLIHEDDSALGSQVDHIISEKHGGETSAQNLASTCTYCNLRKGSDIASVIPGTHEVVPFYNPRRDKWRDHFALAPDGITITTKTGSGEATSRILGFNDPERLEEREILRDIGRYPTDEALRLI